MNRVSLGGWLLAVAVVVAAGSAPALGQEEYSGAFYFGNSSPGNGIIGPADVTNIKLQTASGTGNYFGCKPDSYLLQDVDGDGNVAPADVGKIRLWVTGNFATGAEGKAYSLEVLTPAFNVPTGATCADGPQLCVKVWDNPGLGNMTADLRNGWGVNFKVDPASECPTVILCGRDPTPGIGGGKDQFIQDTLVFQYSGLDDPGTACVRVADPGGCGGKTFTIDTYVPDDAEALYQTGTAGRFSGLPAVAGPPMAGTIIWVDPHFVTVTPDPGAVNDGATLQMTATDALDGNVTNVAAWTVTTGACTVSSTGLVSAPEGCANASCTVQATYLGVSGSAIVNVTDNEVADAVDPNCSNVNDGASISCAKRYVSTVDGCVRAGTPACTPACTSGCTGNNTNEGCADATYTVVCNEPTAATDNLWKATGADDFEDQNITEYEYYNNGVLQGTQPANVIATNGVTYGGNTGWALRIGGIQFDGAGDGIRKMQSTAGYTNIHVAGKIWTYGSSSQFNVEYTCNNGAGWTSFLSLSGNGTTNGSHQIVFNTNLTTLNACVNNNAQFGIRVVQTANSTSTSRFNLADNLLITGERPITGFSGTDTATAIDNEAGTFSTLSATACGSMLDPANPVGGVNCTTPNRFSTDGCNRGPAVCAWSFTGSVGAELCANGSYTGKCLDNGASVSDAGTVIDNEAGTWNSLSATACVPVNDGGTISCSRPNRVSSADGCNRGAANCAWTCTAGCSSGLRTGELCMPTLTGAYTGRCTDGPYSVSDASTVINNETAVGLMTVTPPGPITLTLNSVQDFYAMKTFADGCTLSADGSAAWTKTGGCGGATLGGTGIYTVPASGATCTDVVTATEGGVSDGSTVNVLTQNAAYLTRVAVDELLSRSDDFSGISAQLASALAADPTYYPAQYFKAQADYLAKLKSSATDPLQTTCSLLDLYTRAGLVNAGAGTGFYDLRLEPARQPFTSTAGCTVQTYRGHDYLFCPGPSNWAAAQADCRSRGGDLVTVNDMDEDGWIAGELGATSWIGAYKDSQQIFSFGTNGWLWSDTITEGDDSYNNYDNSHFEPSGYWDWNGNYFYTEPCVDMKSTATYLWYDDVCTNAYGYVCEEIADRSQGEVRDAAPTADELNAFMVDCTIPDLEALLAAIGVPPAGFEYSLALDLDGDSLNETFWIDSGEVNLQRGGLNLALAELKIADAYDWNNVDPNDFDGNFGATPIDPLGIISTTYLNLGNMKSGGATQLAAAEVNAANAEALYKQGINFILAEGSTDCASGLLNICRHGTFWGSTPYEPEEGIELGKLIDGFQNQADIDKFIADAGRVNTEADGIVAAFATDSYHSFMVPPGAPDDPQRFSNFNFYKFWAGVNFRGTFFKTVVNPVKTPTRTVLGVTDLSQLNSADMLTALGLTSMANGTTIVVGDLQNGYALRIDSPKVSTKTIDGSTADWDTAGLTNCDLISSPPRASLQYPRPPAGMGAAYAAVDGENLYLLFEPNLVDDSDQGKINLRGATGEVEVSWDWYRTGAANSNLIFTISALSSGAREIKVPLSNFGNSTWVELALSSSYRESPNEVKPGPIFIQVPALVMACGTGGCEPDKGETYLTCPTDCVCGDGVCDAAEFFYVSCFFPDCYTKPNPPLCGDGWCYFVAGENFSTCPADCPFSVCGDNVCDVGGGEDFNSCSVDCMCYLGDGVCSPCEDSSYSPDCYCGDGICDLYERYMGTCSGIDCP